MIQQILIGIIFLGAIFYLGRMITRNFSPDKKGCAKGCGCDAIEPVTKTNIIKSSKTQSERSI
jgi:hypothetical protein